MDKLRFATLPQIQVIENLGGYRNAHRILHRMEKDGAVRCMPSDRKIYYVSNRGKARIDSTKDVPKRGSMEHSLLRNEIFIAKDMPENWRNEVPIKLHDRKIIADAMYVENGVRYFVEVDNKHKMQANYEKIVAYAMAFRALADEKCVLVWATITPSRRDKLRLACKKAGIEYEIM